MAIGGIKYNIPVDINVNINIVVNIAEVIPTARMFDINPDDGRGFPIILLYIIAHVTSCDEVTIRKNQELKKISHIIAVKHFEKFASDFTRTHRRKRVFPTNKKLVIPHSRNHENIEIIHIFAGK